MDVLKLLRKLGRVELTDEDWQILADMISAKEGERNLVTAQIVLEVLGSKASNLALLKKILRSESSELGLADKPLGIFEGAEYSYFKPYKQFENYIAGRADNFVVEGNFRSSSSEELDELVSLKVVTPLDYAAIDRELVIELDLGAESEVLVSLYDNMGELIDEPAKHLCKSGHSSIEMKFKDLSFGRYYLRVSRQNGQTRIMRLFRYPTNQSLEI